MGVLTLTPKTTGPSGPPPNETTIRLLRGLLERAVTGEVQEVGLAAVTVDQTVITCFNHAGDCQLLGAVASLQFRIQKALYDGN